MVDSSNREESKELRTGRIEPNFVRDAQFPHFDIREEDDRNEDIVPPAVEGIRRGELNPTADPTRVTEFLGGAGEERVTFHTDTPFGDVVSFSGIPPDMSGASSENVVLVTGNTFAALSVDQGVTFTALDPTTIFPSGPTVDAAGNPLDNGLCCDQVIQYVHEFDLWIWLMQFAATGPGPLQGINKLRIAAARTSDVRDSGGTAWSYWDFFSGDFGLNVVLDYPDLAVGNLMLNISVDAVGIGLLVFRVPFADLAAGGAVSFDFTDPNDSGPAYGGHLSQNTGDTVYWAGNQTTSQLRVYSLPEGTGSYSWRDIDMDSYPNTDYSSIAPDGATDWLQFMAGFPGDGIIGLTRRQLDGTSELWLAWTAARGGGFPHPHVRVVELDTDTWEIINQWQIWNPDHAFAYPCLATNREQEVGISLAWGGNVAFGNFAVGILGDFVVWYSEASDAALTRWGDYVTARRAGRPDLFSGVGYAVLQNAPPATGTRFNPRYTLFGRP